MKYSVLSSIIIFLLVSCTKEIPFPDSTVEPVIVVNSTFTKQNDFVVDVSSSIANSLNSIPEKIDNATVIITDLSNNHSETLNHLWNGKYSLENFQPDENTEYHIEVSAPNFASINSNSISNSIPGEFSFEIKDHYLGYYKGTESYFVTIEIVDNPDEENFYLIEIEDFINEGIINGSNNVYGHFTDDINADKIDNINTVDGDLGGQSKIFLSDINFNGEKYTFKFWWSEILLQSLSQTTGNYIECHVRSVSKTYYDYEKSLESHKHSFYQDFGGSSPVQIISNINNGFGLFAGYLNHYETIDIN